MQLKKPFSLRVCSHEFESFYCIASITKTELELLKFKICCICLKLKKETYKIISRELSTKNNLKYKTKHISFFS